MVIRNSERIAGVRAAQARVATLVARAAPPVFLAERRVGG
jgi:hypothetical protein